MASNGESVSIEVDVPRVASSDRFSVEVVAAAPPAVLPLAANRKASVTSIRPPSRQSSIMEEEERAEVHADADGNNDVEAAAERRRRRSSVTLSPETLEAEEQRERSSQISSAGGKRLTPKRSSFMLTPRPLKHYLTREVLPHVDHYRNRLSFNKGGGVQTTYFTSIYCNPGFCHFQGSLTGTGPPWTN